MRNIEFIALCDANTNKTRRIRTYSGPWYSAVSRIPDKLTTKIGKIIALIHDKLDLGYFCKQDECLQVYDFQPLFIHKDCLQCSLTMIIKPLKDIHNTEQNIGKPFELVVDGRKAQVTNTTKALLDAGILDMMDIEEGNLEKPVIYGSYMDYQAPCSFVAVVNYRPIQDINEFYNGMLDKSEMILQSRVFDGLTEAYHYLSEKEALGRYVLELTGPKESIETFKTQGLSKQILKIINFFDKSVTINPCKDVQKREDRIDVECQLLEEVIQSNS